MKSKINHTQNKNILNAYTITEKGSLGLLALGDIGLRAWRKARRANEEKK